MENKINFLDLTEEVFNISDDCKLDKVVFELLDEELTTLSEYFSSTKIEAFFITNVAILSLETRWISLDELKEHFNCSEFALLRYNNELIKLFNSDFFILADPKRLRLVLDNSLEFKCNKVVLNGIVLNKKPNFEPPIDSPKKLNKFNFLKEINNLLIDFYHLEINSDPRINDLVQDDFETILKKINKICKKYEDHPVNKFFKKYNFDNESKLIFTIVLWNKLRGDQPETVNGMCSTIYGRSVIKISKVQDILIGKQFLIKNKLVALEINKSNVECIVISQKAIKELKQNNFIFYSNNNSHLDIIEVNDINVRKLFYNTKVTEQIEHLKSIIQANKLTIIQDRLSSLGLVKGITSIFYGAPGTGKTETVLQLAKQSNRNIMKVDISKLKTKWYGESQKLIKGVFDDYRNLCLESVETPILFFNEADAVFSKRSESTSLDSNKTENEIQNILLDELENFEGILMATTNLEGSLDEAFERRFLFKIKIDKPNKEVTAKIWNAKIPSLNDDQSKKLADLFDFSGGQINNVLRKKQMAEVLSGNNIEFEEILKFCNEETFNKQTRKAVGFIN